MAKTYKKQRKKSTYVSKGTGRSHQIRERQKPKQLTEKQKLYRKTKEQVDIVNKRLRNLERGGFEGTWASKKLMGRLTGGKLKQSKLVKRGKIKISRDLSTTKLIAISQASHQFLESKTSTTRGISETRNSVIQSLKEHYGDVGKDISYKQAEVLYNMFDNTDFTDLARYSNASTVWTNVIDYINKEIDEETLIDRLYRYGNIDSYNDADMRDKVNDLIDYLKG